jgi:hypothetical protein
MEEIYICLLWFARWPHNTPLQGNQPGAPVSLPLHERFEEPTQRSLAACNLCPPSPCRGGEVQRISASVAYPAESVGDDEKPCW